MSLTLDLLECAEFLKIEKAYALKLAGEGILPGAKVGKAWVFLQDDLVEYLRATVQDQRRERQSIQQTEIILGRVPQREPGVKRGPGRPAREKPVLEQIFDADGNLKPEYSSRLLP